MRNVWMVTAIVIAGLLVTVGRAAAQTAEYTQSGKTIYVYQDEWDGDDSSFEVAVRVVHWRSGFETWAWGRIRPESDDVEVWDSILERPAISGKAVTGPHQKYYGGVDCWDTPQQNDRYGRVVLESLRLAGRNALGGALSCMGKSGNWLGCVGGPLVGALWSPIIIDTTGYLWTCFGSR